MNPLSTSRNKYHENRKNSTVYTPLPLCEWLFDIIRYDGGIKKGNIFDPCIGTGNLIYYFNTRLDHITGEPHYFTFGMDIVKDRFKDFRFGTHVFKKYNFLKWGGYWHKNISLVKEGVDLIVMNPPFNVELDGETRAWLKENKKGKALLPELFIEHAFELFGYDTPLVCIAPMGLMYNQRMRSKRYRKFREWKSQITSFIPLPLDIFEGVEFHCGIYIWNIPSMKPHYYVPASVIEQIENERK